MAHASGNATWVDYPATTTLVTAATLENQENATDRLTTALFGATGRTYPVSAKYKLTADLPLNTNTNAQLTGWTSISDKDSIFSSNAWTIPFGSRFWHVKASLRFGGSAGGGYRYIYLLLNSATVTTSTILAQDGRINAAVSAPAGDYCNVSFDGPLNSGDVLRVAAVQSSGGTLTISAATQSINQGDTWFSLADGGPA